MAIELVSDGVRAVILPEHGGRLHQLVLGVGAVEQALLASPADPGAYGREPMRGGSFPMAPWANRVNQSSFTHEGTRVELPADGYPHAIHGRVFTRPWEVVARTKRVVELACAFDEGWPWAGRAWQRFELTPDSLVMKLEVRSEREQFPASCGWHPWFRRRLDGGEDVRVTLNAGYRYAHEALIPTGERVPTEGEYDLSRGEPLGDRQLDDCFSRISGPALLDWGPLALRVSVECPNPHVQVYTEPDTFCFEPQTAAPDSFNLQAAEVSGTGFALASPGKPVGITSRWAWYRR